VPDADVRVGGRYRLDRKLASGGMGAVWQAWDERLHRTIALKRLHLQPWLNQSERDVGVQRALREARITARLHHPNVVQVYDVVDDPDSPCLIMEYVPSQSLSDVVRERGSLPPEEVARIGAQVAAGLAAAHAAGVVHRDVKPGNVLITTDGTAKVTDFGISHAFDDITLTATGLLVGTPAYLAPEVARGTAPDFASDVYSLGATLYMAVEGRAPFGTDDNPMAVLHRVASGEWEPPQRAGALTPLLTRMMAVDPKARPSMTEVSVALAERRSDGAPAESAAATTQVLSVRTSPPPPAARGERRRRGIWLPLVVLFVVLAVGAVASWALLSGDNASSGSGGTGPTVRTTTPPASTPQTHSGQGNAGQGSGVGQGNSGQGNGGGHGNGGGSSAGTTAPVNPGGSPSAAELAAAITEYFQIVPGDLQSGWDRLTPHFQETRAGGWDSYQSYWHTVDHVDVSNVVGSPPDGASADLVYYYTDGRVVPQHTSFTLVRQGGVLKIDWES
jgi:serine/threonine protein kinase